MDPTQSSRTTETSAPSDDEFIEEEHECCEHVERDNRGLVAWLAFLIFLFFTIALFVE